LKAGKLYIFSLIVLLPLLLKGQADTSINYKKRKQILWIGAATGYAGSMTFLYHAWYKNYEQSDFHFINDGKAWMLQDKAGHTITSYYITNYTFNIYRWAGYNQQQSMWMAGATGFFYQTVIEVLDGFSAKWGASYADLLANSTGSFLYIGQKRLWNEQRIIPKYSYHNTEFPKYRPDLLGSTLAENILKDYNAHTYWLSANLDRLAPQAGLPRWLNIAVGYNAYGMTGGDKNVLNYNGKAIPPFKRTGRLILAPDIDFKRIETGSAFLQNFLGALRFLKAPAPAIEYDFRKGFRFYLLYY